MKKRFDTKWIPEPSGCWVWTSACNQQGYGQFWFDGKSCKAHRVSWLLHKGEIPDNLQVLHKCDTPSCVNPDHLFLGDQRANMGDAVQKGRMAKGSDSGRSKLSEHEAREIFASPLSQRVLASMYQVSPTSIRYIKRGRNWKYLAT